jgi:hypothetical protein
VREKVGTAKRKVGQALKTAITVEATALLELLGR